MVNKGKKQIKRIMMIKSKLKSELEKLDNAAMKEHVTYVATTNDFKIASDAYAAASDAADAAWDDYEDTLNSPNREIWIAARAAYDAANDAADTAYDACDAANIANIAAQNDYSNALYAAAICADKIINKGK